MSNATVPSIPTVEKDASSNPRYCPWMVVARKGRNQNGKGKEKIQDSTNHQNGNSNKGSRFGVLFDNDDGGNNQNEGNESSVAILSSMVPINIDPHVLNGSKNIAARKKSLTLKIVAKQPSRAQHQKTHNKKNADNTILLPRMSQTTPM
ncbi:hypothetical protein WN944_026591 [Citrus x changshan-huyou]|uniref:Uncharacterized protein n=1 Tax=Citrus x changshan-huyou TaxID=2935761 RepID=A0AAP0QE19_9ROSI